MSGGARGRKGDQWRFCPGGFLFIFLVVLLNPREPEAAITCPDPVQKGCSCESRKDSNHLGGWEISCIQDKYRIEYAIRSFVKLECTGAGEHKIPPFAPAMFQKYNLTDVDFFHFSLCPLPVNLTLWEVLEGVTVKKLKFENDIPGIYFDSNTFEGFSSLQSLILSMNQLESVPDDLFRNLTSLKSIELRENALTSLPKSLFENLDNLSLIHLGGNKLTELPTEIFSNLTNLQRLYLYKNQLKELPSEIFSGLKSLIMVDLANNQLRELNRQLFADAPNLQHLNVLGNNLTKLESDLLRGMNNLKELKLSFNKLTKLPENLLDGLTALTTIWLNDCNLKGIGESFFSYAGNLSEITLYNNKITSLPQNLFAKNLHLQQLHLQYNDLLELPNNIFDKNFYLETLKITHNNLTSLPKGVFDHVSNLKTLDLTGNSLKSLEADLLSQNQKLEELKIAKNNLTGLKGSTPFGQSSAIRIVDFSYNQIVILPDIEWNIYLSLEEIAFNHNNLTSFKVPNVIYNPVGTKIELMFNQIANVDIENVKYIESFKLNPTEIAAKVKLRGNPLNCDCKLFSFFDYASDKGYRKTVDFTDLEELECHEPSWLAGAKLSDVTPDVFVCQVTDGCSSNCYCLERAKDNAVVVNCSHLTDLPDDLPVKTSEVHLEGNQIKNLDSLGTVAWENVTKLYLDRNGIEESDWPLPPKLQVISLRGNQLDRLPRSLAEFVENRNDVKVYLGDNPWLCNCETLQFKNWLYDNALKIRDINEMYCSNTVFQNGSEVRTTVGKLTEDICPVENVVDNSQVIIVSVICAILACLLFVVSVFYYRNKQTVIAYIYINFYNIFVCFFNDDDLDEDKTFDAFVSYSSADRDVALDLVGHLENGDPSFKLCIHERDWLPGNLISWNIVNSVQNSRKTILVLSKDFLESVWFQVEFHTAYYQMLEDRIDRLIVIVKGDLPNKNTLDKDLQLLLSTKTFLEWGERWFWEKLRYALPHRRSTNKVPNGKNSLQDKSFPLRQRPNPGLLKTVEEKIVSLSGDTIFSKRTESPSQNGETQINMPPANPVSDSQVSSVQINSTKAQSRRFNSARTNSMENGLNNRQVVQETAPS